MDGWLNMKVSGWSAWKSWVAISFLMIILGCEKEGFQPDIITTSPPKTTLSISVIHFYSFSPLQDSGVSTAEVSLYPSVLDIQSNGNPYRMRTSDSLGFARFGEVDTGWWYIRTQSSYLGSDLDSVYVTDGATAQVFEVWYP
jgi:hypothetical protein